MKKFLVGTLLILLTVNVDAQWYSKYGVNDINELSETQLNFALQQFDKNYKAGRIVTLVGIGSELFGWSMALIAISTWSSSKFLEYSFFILVPTGIVTMCVGIPLWSVNANRKKDIELALAKFNTASFLGNNQPTYFGYKQPSAFGLSVKISF